MVKTNSNLNLFYPQWQGGGPDKSTYHGAYELRKFYCKDTPFVEVDVSTADIGIIKNDIYCYDQILKQMKSARRIIEAAKPSRIFTIGGGCDAGILPISYLSRLLEGKLTLIWLDAHGDLNTPESSPSGHFYGMPVRTLLGDGERGILELLYSELEPDQIVLGGLRDLDPAEVEFIKTHQLSVCKVEDLKNDPGLLLEAVKGKGNKHVYIHLDLDVLDPDEFPYLPMPVPGGLSKSTLLCLIESLSNAFVLNGLGIYEYSPSGKADLNLLKQLFDIGIGL